MNINIKKKNEVSLDIDYYDLLQEIDPIFISY